MSWTFAWGRGAGIAVLCAACSAPSYDDERDAAPDAAMTAEPAVDANMPVEDARAPVEDARAPDDGSTPEPFPLGPYAVLARFHGTSVTAGGGWFGEEAIVLADVRREGNGLAMRWQTCAYRGRLAVPLIPLIDYVVLNPEAFPTRTLQLVVNGNTFQTVGEPSRIGYEERPDCAAGTSESHPDRPWLAGGQCSCPTSSLPPTSPSDCRVIDSDGDQQPGFTVQFTGGTENFSRSRIRDASQLAAGLIAPDGRHLAQFAVNVDNYQLSCAREPCSRGSVQLCPLAQNPVRFLRLEPRAWTCAEVVDAVDAANELGLGPIMSPGC